MSIISSPLESQQDQAASLIHIYHCIMSVCLSGRRQGSILWTCRRWHQRRFQATKATKASEPSASSATAQRSRHLAQRSCEVVSRCVASSFLGEPWHHSFNAKPQQSWEKRLFRV